MSAVEQCRSATKELKGLLANGDLEAAAPVLKRIKLILIQFTTSRGNAAEGEQATAEIAAAVDALESFVIYSVKSQDDMAFGRYFAQLRSYYGMTTVEATPLQPKMLGLNLLRLLVDNRLAEFHSELELVPHSCTNNKFVQFPVALERGLMEGMYKRVLQARKNFPDPLFEEYLDALESAVRSEISQCAAASYPKLGLAAAQKLLNFENREDLLDYCEIYEDWVIDGETIRFPEKQETRVTREDIPSRRTIGEVLSFAARLERIV